MRLNAAIFTMASQNRSLKVGTGPPRGNRLFTISDVIFYDECRFNGHARLSIPVAGWRNSLSVACRGNPEARSARDAPVSAL